ncbi:MAG TPA: ATP-binding protein [Dyadobacter sp.]|nr:ATP-binding protein [Dyadobacter sp.]
MSTPPPNHLLFEGPGEMRALCRAFNWAESALGAVSDWPQSLRTAAQMALASPFPNIILWGPDLIQIYNDGYRVVMDTQHPKGLGQFTRECWPEVWHINEPIYQRVWKGESFSFENSLYRLSRSGKLQDFWLTIAYSPILDESENVGGILVTLFDNTAKVLEEQKRNYVLQLSDALRLLTDSNQIQIEASRALSSFLKADRVGFAEVMPDEECVVVSGYYGDRLPDMKGTYRVGEYDPGLIGRLQAGQTCIRPNVAEDESLTTGQRDAYALLRLGATVTVPLIKQNSLIAIFFVSHEEPRSWSPNEIALIEETADRAWMAVERARAEEALRSADRQKDEFLAMMAHELRNPMATIRNGLNILNHQKDTDSQATMLMMNRQVDHLVRMLDDLLDVSRVSQNKIQLKEEQLELGLLLRAAVEAVEIQNEGQRSKIVFTPAPSPIHVLGDGTRLTQVFTNLLINGLRYTDHSGEVQVSLESNDCEALVRVTDNGIGIESDQLKSIFELFVQVDNSHARSKGGLGIGLTLVNRLIAMHGGRIQANSQGLGKGSEFVVCLPLAKSGPIKASDDKVVPGSSCNQRILVIDDNDDAGMTLAMLLRINGYETHYRTSGRDGIEAAKSLSPGIILCDIGMPEMDGYETCHLLRQQHWSKGMILVALTGYGQEKDKQLAREAGFDHHFLKPVDINELLVYINSLES